MASNRVSVWPRDLPWPLFRANRGSARHEGSDPESWVSRSLSSVLRIGRRMENLPQRQRQRGLCCWLFARPQRQPCLKQDEGFLGDNIIVAAIEPATLILNGQIGVIRPASRGFYALWVYPCRCKDRGSFGAVHAASSNRCRVAG